VQLDGACRTSGISHLVVPLIANDVGAKGCGDSTFEALMYGPPKRSDRPIGHPFLIARLRPAEIELPPGAEAPAGLVLPISARQALEAAFTASGPTNTGSSSPTRAIRAPAVVVVKRRRTLEPAAAFREVAAHSPRVDQTAAPEESRHIDSAGERTPRVFRLEQSPEPAVAAQESQLPAISDNGLVPTADAGISSDLDIEPLPTVSARRPRRRPSTVTVTSFVSAGDVARSGHATKPQDLDSLTFLPPARSGPLRSAYQALQLEIARLKKEAEAARKTEAAQAVAWIKKAIQAYGVTACDLGL
jgi:hypothetical protein